MSKLFRRSEKDGRRCTSRSAPPPPSMRGAIVTARRAGSRAQASRSAGPEQARSKRASGHSAVFYIGKYMQHSLKYLDAMNLSILNALVQRTLHSQIVLLVYRQLTSY